MIDGFKDQVEWQSLRAGAGRAIFCRGKHCGRRCMDVSRTVEISLWEGTECISVGHVCGKCADARIAPILATAKKYGLRIETIDGRCFDKHGFRTGPETLAPAADDVPDGQMELGL